MSVPAFARDQDPADDLIRVLATVPHGLAQQLEAHLLRAVGEFRQSGDSRPVDEAARHVLAVAALVRNPAYLRAVEDVYDSPPDWTSPGLDIEEWQRRLRDARPAGESA